MAIQVNREGTIG